MIDIESAAAEETAGRAATAMGVPAWTSGSCPREVATDRHSLKPERSNTHPEEEKLIVASPSCARANGCALRPWLARPIIGQGRE
jgi:hypothetical protein